MARIVAGLATSHVPAIGTAIDQGTTDEPYLEAVIRRLCSRAGMVGRG